ncbi:hypothetical protein D3C71_989550 [compost metagenome]
MLDFINLDAVRLFREFVTTKLAELLAAVNNKAAEVLAAINGQGIKSIQRGVVQIAGTTTTVTITAVDMSKAELRVNGFRVASLNMLPTVALTANNTITATRGDASGSVGWVAWELTEWK